MNKLINRSGFWAEELYGNIVRITLGRPGEDGTEFIMDICKDHLPSLIALLKLVESQK